VKRKFHLTHARDFLRVKSKNQAVYHPLMILVFAQNDLEFSRTAVIASKKVGNAVIRNRARRRIQAELRDYWNDIKPGWDLIFYSRNAIVDADYQDIKNAIMHLLQKAGAI
jgi:ribonuclease P protein component